MDETEKTLDSLPPDILAYIFLRVPVESLACLTLTSHFFDDFITNNLDLVYSHLERATPVVYTVSTENVTNSKGKGKGERLTNQAVLSKFRNMKFSNPFHLDERFALAGSYNGLVCFYQCSTDQQDQCGYYYKYNRSNIWEHPLLNQENMEKEEEKREEEKFRIYLWNPALHEIRALPKPIGNNDFVAFGYDPSSHDYKILWISRGKRYKAEVYSWKNKSWKIICKNFKYVPIGSAGTYIVCFEGSLHWVSGSNRQSNGCVSAFNIADECLDVYKVPEYVREKGNTLGVLGGNVSLLVASSFWFSWEIWLLDKSSRGDCPWTKTFQFHMQPWTFQLHVHRDDDEYICGLTASGKIMVSSQGREEYDLIDPDTISFEELKYKYNSKSYLFIDYVETLISVYPPRKRRWIV